MAKGKSINLCFILNETLACIYAVIPKTAKSTL